MGLFGDLVIGALGGFPSKPDVPATPTINAQTAQATSTAGNKQALPGLEDLASTLNTYNQGQRTKAVNAGIPGYAAITGQGSNVLQSELRGELSPDVAASVRRNANTRAFAGGYAGSGAGGNLTARDLGLTSLDLQQRGQALAPGWLSAVNAIGVAPQVNPATGFISPEQQLSVDQTNANNTFSTQWLRNQLAALPDPQMAAIAKDVGGITDLVAAAALAWAGGGIGGALGGAGGAALGSNLGGQIGGGSPSYGSMFGGLFGGGGGGGGGALGGPTGTFGGAGYNGTGFNIDDYLRDFVPPSNNTVNPLGAGYGNFSGA